jgi:hypothetical protein
MADELLERVIAAQEEYRAELDRRVDMRLNCAFHHEEVGQLLDRVGQARETGMPIGPLFREVYGETIAKFEEMHGLFTIPAEVKLAGFFEELFCHEDEARLRQLRATRDQIFEAHGGVGSYQSHLQYSEFLTNMFYGVGDQMDREAA